VRASAVELAVLDARHEGAPRLTGEAERGTGGVLAVPYGHVSVRPGRHLDAVVGVRAGAGRLPPLRRIAEVDLTPVDVELQRGIPSIRAEFLLPPQ